MSTPWLTAAELAGLPGMPGSEFRTRAKLTKLQVPSRLREGSKGGGGREFDTAALPEETRRALLLQVVAKAPEVPARALVPAPAPVPALRDERQPPTQAQAACADARVQLVRRLHDMTDAGAGVTRATEELARALTEGEADESLLDVAATANQRARVGAGAGVPISARTLFRWHSAHREGGWWALIPAPSQPKPLAAIGEDVAAVLKAYASANGAARNLTHCAQRVNDALGRPFDDWRRLYDQARRAVAKLDKKALIKARHTGAQRDARLPFKRRDTSTIKPLDVVVVDGHTFKAKVRHPDHGQPFAPEVTLVLDAATRKILGWSASLSENTIAVGDAIRHAVGQHGVPAIVYSDNGAGERAKAFDCPVAGLFARLGTEHRTGLPGKPQGHGIIERSWQTHMLRCARQFATYQGGDVDERSLRKVTLELAREGRALKRQEAGGDVVRLSPKVPSWAAFLAAVEQTVADYNGKHRHRGLPKHTEGPAEGRHLTPDEAWALMLQPDDQVMLDAASLRHVFMPAVLRTAQRGEVRWLNAQYFSDDLMQVDGEQVRVHYDIHDASRVYVWTTDGRFVCEAVAGANRMGYMPDPVVVQARHRRVAAKLKRLDSQAELAQRELQPTLPAPDVVTPFRVTPQRATELVERLDTPAPSAVHPDERPPMWDSPAERYEWLMAHRPAWQEGDAAWLAAYAASPDYQALREYFESRAIAWPDEDDAAFKHAG